jgi:hypothetical protein
MPRPVGWLPLGQLIPMLLHDLEQPGILDVPKGLPRAGLGQESQVRQQLAEADVRLKLDQLGQHLE